jgi:hypothetical protein
MFEFEGEESSTNIIIRTLGDQSSVLIFHRVEKGVANEAFLHARAKVLSRCVVGLLVHEGRPKQKTEGQFSVKYGREIVQDKPEATQ